MTATNTLPGRVLFVGAMMEDTINTTRENAGSPEIVREYLDHTLRTLRVLLDGADNAKAEVNARNAA